MAHARSKRGKTANGLATRRKRVEEEALSLCRPLVGGRAAKELIGRAFDGRVDSMAMLRAWIATMRCICAEQLADRTPCELCDGEGERVRLRADGSEAVSTCGRCRGSGLRAMSVDAVLRILVKVEEHARKCVELEATTSVLDVPGHVIIDIQHPALMMGMEPRYGEPPPPPPDGVELPDPRGDIVEVK